MTLPRDPEAIRAAALAHLGARDPRARRILATARIATEPDDAAWESSGGSVRGVRVLLGVDPRALGAVEAHPAIHDALGEALAAAVSGPGVAMTTLRLHWSNDREPALRAYRGAASPVEASSEPSADAIAGALVAFVEGAGEEAIARELARATVTIRAHRRAEVIVHAGRSSEQKRLRDVVEWALAKLLPAWSTSVRSAR